MVTENHQRDILTILSRGHTTYLDHLTSIFQLHTAPPDELVKLVRRVLDAGRLKEGVVFIATFEIQHRFSMEQVGLVVYMWFLGLMTITNCSWGPTEIP